MTSSGRRVGTADRGRCSRSWRWAALVAVAAAVAGHLWFWYAPRLRLAVPSAGGLPASLLDDERFSVRLWLAYPHQNLARAAAAVDDPAAYLESVARLAGAAAQPWLPGFGPFDVPPSSELTVAVGEHGEGVVAARIYPSMAIVGRLAGLVARNPWLAGGEVAAAGRPARVRWEGALWLLETGAAGAASSAAGSSPPSGDPAGGEARARPPGLAAVAVSRVQPPLLPGTYVVAPTPSGGVVCRRLAQETAPAPILPRLVDPGVALAVVEREHAESGETTGLRALLLSRPASEEPGELPGAAAVASSGDRRFSLPGEGLASVLGLRLHEREVDGLHVVALDRGSLEAATHLAAGLAGERAGGAPFELWGDPPALLELATRLSRALGRVPILGRREVRFWQDVERVLSPFGRFGSVTLVSTHSALEMRLERWGQLTEPP